MKMCFVMVRLNLSDFKLDIVVQPTNSYYFSTKIQKPQKFYAISFVSLIE